jgi:hypothetical protein
MASNSLAGKYVGRCKVREGREDELGPADRKQLSESAKVEIELRDDGTFVKQITEGIWKRVDDRILFTPVKFGGKTEVDMREAAEEMGRAFGLAFVFNPFELLVRGETLVSPEEGTLLFVEYTKG